MILHATVESKLDQVVRVEILQDGSAGMPEVYAEGLASVPDGLAFDAERNLYVTNYASNCIYRVSRPDHRLERLCRDVENLTYCQATKWTFGRINFDQLYVVNLGRDHILALDLRINGQPVWCHRAPAEGKGEHAL